MKTYGYSRVSTGDQTTETQRDILRKNGCSTVLEESASGKTRDGRPKLAMLLEIVDRGDRVVVTALDRVSRDTVDMLEIVREIGKKGVGFRSLSESWACFEPPAEGEDLNPMAELVLTIMGGVAQFQRKQMLQKQRQGIDRAKAKGEISEKTGRPKYSGRVKKFDPVKIRSMRAEGIMPAVIAAQLGCDKKTVKRALANGKSQ